VEGFEFRNTGTLINSRYVLTSTEAIPSTDEQGVQSTLSLSHVHVGVSGGQDPTLRNRISIEKVITHPDAVMSSLKHDIVLLRLAEPVEFDEATQPICLPTGQFKLQKSSELKVAGWGVLGPGLKSFPDPAYHVSMKEVPLEFCDRVYAPLLGRLDNSSICANSMSIYKDGGLCRGDAGDPLMLESMEVGRGGVSMKKTTQIGIASYSIGCRKQGFPSVFVNVSKYLPWILDNIEP